MVRRTRICGCCDAQIRRRRRRRGKLRHDARKMKRTTGIVWHTGNPYFITFARFVAISRNGKKHHMEPATEEAI